VAIVREVCLAACSALEIEQPGSPLVLVQLVLPMVVTQVASVVPVHGEIAEEPVPQREPYPEQVLAKRAAN
jgi:hypothetical protein